MRKNFYLSRKLKYGSVATVFTITFVAVVVIFNIIFSALASKYNWYIDMTKEQVFTLSEEAKDIMSDIKNEINIYFASDPDVLMNTGNTAAFTRYIYTTALQLEEAFDNVHVECVNVLKNPSFFREFYTTAATDIDTDSVVVESNGEVRVFKYTAFFTYNDTSDISSVWAYSGEKKLISGIMQVTQADSPKIVFTTDHGEDFDSSATALATMFSDNGFEVQTKNLANETLDDDTRIIVIFNPTYDFVGFEAEDPSKNEIAKIDEFLDGYGTLLVFCDAENAANLTNLNEFLAEWGISYTADTFVRDMDHSMSVDGYSIVSEYQSGNTTGGSLYSDLNALAAPPKVMIRKASPINILWTESTLTGTRNVSPVFKSYNTSELVKDGQPGETGSFNLATISRQTSIEQNEYYYSYVFAFGSPSFASNNYINSNAYANEDILSAALKAAGRERVLASLELKAFDKDEITITTKEANDWTIAMTLVLPILIAGCGIFVITRRKHS